MKPALSLLAAAILFSATLTGCAPKREANTSSTAAAPTAEAQALHEKLVPMIPNLKLENIRASAAAGLYEVQDGSNFGYVTADGKYLIAGDLVDLGTGESLTENSRKADRIAKLAAVDEKRMIVFAPPGGGKHVVTVFTDIDCGYCRKLHSEIARYNDAGITIRYLAYPRAGLQSDSARKAEVVWCSSDPKAALTQAKAGEAVAGEARCTDVVARDYALGNDMGLRGTPLLILEDGSVVNGYVPAEVLAQRLEQAPARAATQLVAPQG